MQSIQQPLFTFLTASEDRISKNIDGLKDISTTSSMSQKPILDELGEFLWQIQRFIQQGEIWRTKSCLYIEQFVSIRGNQRYIGYQGIR